VRVCTIVFEGMDNKPSDENEVHDILRTNIDLGNTVSSEVRLQMSPNVSFRSSVGFLNKRVKAVARCKSSGAGDVSLLMCNP
jgi:hypothetical protein